MGLVDEENGGAGMSLGALLRMWRRRALLTQEQLAQRAGLNVRTVRRLENDGLLQPRTTSVLLLAKALDLNGTEQATLNAAAHRHPADPSAPATTGPLAPTATGSPAAARMPVACPPAAGMGTARIGTARPAVADPRPWTIPRQLPADVAAPGVREREVACVEGRTTTMPEPHRAVVLINGMAGMGKTVLAVHAAHRLAPLFPDGQLFVDLHGHTQATAPVEPAAPVEPMATAPVEPGAALARVLRTLGVPAEHIPWHLDDRAALYRSVLADRRLLIVLDDAADEHQLHPLLPATPGCQVIVTSRRRLTCPGDAQILSLDTLPLTEAIALFTRTTGRAPDTPPDVLAKIVRRCGLLPLAIRIAAIRLQTHPAWNAHHLLDRLKTDPLAELTAGHQSVTAALNRSYERLPPDHQKTYRLLASTPHPTFPLTTAAALLNTTTPQATRLLDHLLHANLLQEPTPGHYRLHTLLHAHASTLQPPPDVETTLRLRCRTALLT